MARFEADGDPAGGVVNVARARRRAVDAERRRPRGRVVHRRLRRRGRRRDLRPALRGGRRPDRRGDHRLRGRARSTRTWSPTPAGSRSPSSEDGEVYSLGFDSAGNPLTDRERVNQNAGGLQNAPVAATAPDGRLVVAFNSSAGDRGALRQIRPDDLQAVGDDIPVSESGAAGAPHPGRHRGGRGRLRRRLGGRRRRTSTACTRAASAGTSCRSPPPPPPRRPCRPRARCRPRPRTAGHPRDRRAAEAASRRPRRRSSPTSCAGCPRRRSASAAATSGSACASPRARRSAARP